MIGLLTNFRQCEQGATMVEMGVVMSVAVLFILGMIEFALAYYYQHDLLIAVEQAGRYAMIQGQSNIDTTTVATNAASLVCNVLGSPCTNVTAGGVCSQTAGQYCVKADLATGANGTKMLTMTANYAFSFINVTGSGLTLTGQTTVALVRVN